MSVNPNSPPPSGFGPNIIEWLIENVLLNKRRLNAISGGSGVVNSISGTSNRIDISGSPADPVVDISPNYVIDSAHVSTPTIDGATYDTVKEFLDIFTSSGRITGGDITINGSNPTSYDIAPLSGMIAPVNSDLGPILFFDIPGIIGNTTTTDTLIYIGVDYNGGSPIYVVKSSDTWNFNTEFPLGSVINVSGNIAIYNNPWWVSDGISHITERFQSAGKQKDTRVGGLILGESGVRNITMSAGQILDLLNKHPISALDTSVSGHFVTFYYNGTSWISAQATQWPNTQYNDIATGLSSVGPNEYCNLWFYATTFDRVCMLYGQKKFSIAADASTEATPTFMPPELDKFGILIGRILFQGTNPLLRTLNSASDGAFISPVTNAHNNLAGLQGGQDLQYYHLTQNQYNNLVSNIQTIAVSTTNGLAGTVT